MRRSGKVALAVAALLGSMMVSSTQAWASDEPSLLKEAKRLGVTAAVEASGLSRRAQQKLAFTIMKEARANGLDPLLLVAVIQSESSFNTRALSHVGARGLMQVMPDTGAWLLSRMGEKLNRPEDLWNPELNIRLGASYLAELIARFGTVEKALVAYNAGPSAARRILASADQGKRFRAGYPAKVLSGHRRLLASVTPAVDSLNGQKLASGSDARLHSRRVAP